MENNERLNIINNINNNNNNNIFEQEIDDTNEKSQEVCFCFSSAIEVSTKIRQLKLQNILPRKVFNLNSTYPLNNCKPSMIFFEKNMNALSKNENTIAIVNNQVTNLNRSIIEFPNEILYKIFKYLSFDMISKKRIV